MYSSKYFYAGTPDMILFDVVKNYLVIIDYKTNKDLFKNWGYLLEPFDTMECHPYNKYQLQLSYYKIMLEEKGFEVGTTLIIHLKSDGNYIPYETIDLTQELKQHMDNVWVNFPTVSW